MKNKVCQSRYSLNYFEINFKKRKMKLFLKKYDCFDHDESVGKQNEKEK